MAENVYEFKFIIHVTPENGGAYIEFPYDIRNRLKKSDGDEVSVTVCER